MQKASFGTGTSAAARSTTRRTGVHLLPMIIGLVMTAPSQWKKLRISGAADAGEEVLVAAGEADDLVREDRADDDELVVVEDRAVDRDRHVHLEQPAGQRADLVGRDRADVGAARRGRPRRG